MNPVARMLVFFIGMVLTFGAMLPAIGELPPLGSFSGACGQLLNSVGTAERHVLNVVTAVIFDYRGVDTVGEEFILLCAVTGVLLLLREEEEREEKRKPEENEKAVESGVGEDISDAVQAAGFVLSGVIVLYGLYMMCNGHLGMGGGFQGGLITSGAWFMMYFALGARHFHQMALSRIVDFTEGLGAGVFVAVGLFSMAFGMPYLGNFLPLGTTGDLLSSGTILLLSIAVGIEVGSGFLLLLIDFVRPIQEFKPEKE